MDFEKAVITVLKELRTRQHLSQEELAHRAGLYRTYISNLERGLKSPKLKTVYRLSVALKTPMRNIISRAEKLVKS